MEKENGNWAAKFAGKTDGGRDVYFLTLCPVNILSDDETATAIRIECYRRARADLEKIAKTENDTFGPNNTVTLIECKPEDVWRQENELFDEDDADLFKRFDDAIETVVEIASDIQAITRLCRIARDFVFENETWETYLECRKSNSAALPPEFIVLCDAVVRLYGVPGEREGEGEPDGQF